MAKIATALLCASALLAGCALPQVTPPPETAYGPLPDSKQWRAAIKLHFDEHLKDPESAKYRIGCPVRGYMRHTKIYQPGLQFVGWLVRVDVNAKNSYGGYTGFQPYIAALNFSGSTPMVFEAFGPNGFDHILVKVIDSPACSTTLAAVPALAE
jgi:hypothetical protein